MSIYSRMRRREAERGTARIAIAGSGLIGRAMVRQVDLMPGMITSLILNRTTDRAVETLRINGRAASDIVVSDDPAELQAAIDAGRTAVTSSVEALRQLERIDAIVEATGAVEYGAEVAIAAIDGGMHVIMMNAETDATVGCALRERAHRAGLVYTNSDGDQPGVLKRLIDYVDGLGFEVVAAVNCKGFMDIHATPESIRPWAEKQNTSLAMTTAFTDGTKMNIENAVLANATGLLPGRRGMFGVETCMATALEDCMRVFEDRTGLVDYTLGGDFGGGVFVIGRCHDRDLVQPLMQYLKMGSGPDYLFYRPYHLCHFETPLSIAEAILDAEPTIAPIGRPVADVIAIAKKDLQPGDRLDGIGGWTCYGEIEAAELSQSRLPIGLANDVIVSRPIAADTPIPMDSVELSPDGTLMQLRREGVRLAQVS